MSVHISSWVWEKSGAAGNDLLVLLALADQANDSGICWPSQDTLKNRTRLSRATIQRRLAALQDAGVIYVIERNGTSNLYGFSHLRDSVSPQDAAGSGWVPQFEVPRNSEARVPRNSEADGASLGEAQTVNEPSLNRHSARKRASQFPSGFTFADVREWTVKSKIDVGPEEFEQFKDHHLAKGSTMVDWSRAWQTWARNSAKWAKPRGKSQDSWNGSLYGVISNG